MSRAKRTASGPNRALGTCGLAVTLLVGGALPAAAQDTVAPTMLVLSPANNGVMGGTDKVKIQLWDPSGPAATDPVQYRINDVACDASIRTFTSAGVQVNSNYVCGLDCSVYEFDLDSTLCANGSYTLEIRGEDSVANVDTLSRTLQINNAGTGPAGSGHLLRRSTGSLLCIDCHNLPTHSSQHTSTRYGNWAMECLSCHLPHKTTNIFLIREQLETPSSGTKSVVFHFDDDPATGGNETNPGSAVGNYSFLGARDPAASPDPNVPYDDGICEACHTQTSHWRNDEGAPDHTGHDHTHNANVRCLKCHLHDAGFQGSGECLDCHGNTGDAGVGGPNNRRAVLADFAQTSHHVGDGGAMGGALTSFDCVVCHAEGRLDDGGTPADPADDEVRTVGTYHGGDSGTTSIDLKDVDNWDDATGTGTVYAYDKEDIAANTPGGVRDWNSGNQYWREWTSGVDETGGATLPGTAGLDPFCLSCHDGGVDAGATDTANRTDTACGGSPDPLNPFCDAIIGNNNDEQDRTQVVDIESKVSGSPPPEGMYSRHAVRGQSASRYSAYQNIDPDPPSCGTGLDVTCRTIYEGGDTATTGHATLFVQGVCVGGDDDGDPCTDIAGDTDCPGDPAGDCVAWDPNADGLGPLWNDTSVMGCGDCHTVDGAHGSGGNAHGAPSEYLLKDKNDADGVSEGTLAAVNYVCYRCHVDTWYTDNFDHTGRDQDWVDTTGQTGTLRVETSDGNLFGMACTNCHGGRADDPLIVLAGFGTIHGTSQTFGIGEDGLGTDTRNAYRFTNGASLRYFDPDDDPDNDTKNWSADAFECYTLSSPDSWGSCTHHNRGQSYDRPVLRPISY